MSEAKVSLRDFEPGDVAAVQHWFNNTDATHSLMEYRDSMDEEGARRWVEAAMRKDGPDRKWAVLVEGFDEPVGFTALYGVGGQTAPELGAMLGADGLRGKGVGKHAESLTIQKGFDEFGAWRILGLIPANNAPAQAVVTRLGFKHEGTMREHIRRPDGELVDCEVYGLLKSDWQGYP